MNKEKRIAIFLFGRPNSGKGTQAKLLAEQLDLYHFTTSREGKEYIKTHDDEQTKRQIDLYKSGALFEPEWTSRVVIERTGNIIGDSKGIVYDGTPRTLYEAQAVFPAVVDLVGRENIFVFLINISENEFKERAEKRLICNADSRHVYIRSDSLMPGFRCPVEDGVLETRDLDNKDVLEMRTEEYVKKTMPAIKYIEEMCRVIKINGEQSIEDVHKDILKALGL